MMEAGTEEFLFVDAQPQTEANIQRICPHNCHYMLQVDMLVWVLQAKYSSTLDPFFILIAYLIVEKEILSGH
jgi:hypothetical protein